MKKNEYLQGTVQNLTESLGQGNRLPNKRIDDYCSSHQRRRIQQISKSCGDSFQWLQNQGYIPVSVSAVSMSMSRYEDEVNQDDVDMVDMTLYVVQYFARCLP